jgi:hypothetical protein
MLQKHDKIAIAGTDARDVAIYWVTHADSDANCRR